jgi:protein-tyrosine phosphatase
MAEFVLKDMVKKENKENEFFIASAATSTEEIGNPPHPGTRNKLKEHGISCEGKHAVQVKKSDYEKYDFIIVMDGYNINNIRRIFGENNMGKVYKLLDFTGESRDIADPWYSGNFEATYKDVVEGCKAFLDKL